MYQKGTRRGTGAKEKNNLVTIITKSRVRLLEYNWINGKFLGQRFMLVSDSTTPKAEVEQLKQPPLSSRRRGVMKRVGSLTKIGLNRSLPRLQVCLKGYLCT